MFMSKFRFSQKVCVIMSVFALASCSTAYYSAMEKVGIHKRDIMVDRVVDAKESQQEAQEQFKSALEEMTALINFDGGDLEEQYNVIQEQYEDSKEAAELVSLRIEKIEDVSDALFEEWRDEIEEISSANLRRQSSSKLKETERRYRMKGVNPMASSLKRAPIREMVSIERDVSVLIKDMNAAIEQSQKFIDMLEK